MHPTKFLIAFAAILLCSSVEGFTPSFGMKPLQQQAAVFPTSTTELYGKKKKNKFNKENGGGKGRGGVAAVAVLEKPPVEASVEVAEEAPVAIPAAAPVAPAAVVEEVEVPEVELEDPAVKMVAAIEEPPAVVEEEEPPQADIAVVVVDYEKEGKAKALFQKMLLAKKVSRAGIAESNEEKKAKELFQRTLLAVQFENNANEVGESEGEKKASELFQRTLLAQKFGHDAKKELEETMKANELFQRSLLAKQFENDAKGPETVNRRSGPLDAAEEAKLSAKYAAIDDIGERAFEILLDLGFFDRKD